MIQGRSIRLFLVDGTPNGLLTAEIMNWTGHVLTGPRTKLTELVQRPECGRTGIYFLVGPDLEGSPRPQVYIGESDDVGTRLKQHNRPEDKGGKDFWERVCLVTSKDQNLTKAHVKYLESLLIQSASELGRCKLVNGTAHEYINLPESDRADMAFFVEQIRTVLPVLGLDFLRDSHARKPELASSESDSGPPWLYMQIPKQGIQAKAQEYDGEFIIMQGSTTRDQWVAKKGGYQALFTQLCEEGTLSEPEGGLRRFTKDYAFSSPSAAGAIVAGYNINGRTVWKIESSNKTYGEWQDQQVNAAATMPNEVGHE